MRRVVLTLACLLAVEPVWASTPAEAAQIALGNCQKLPLDQQQHTLYLWAGAVPEKDREQFWKVMLFHLNSISREAELTKPAKVADDVWRVDIRDYGWKKDVVNKLADFDPYFHAKVQTVLVPAVVVPVVIAVGDTVRVTRDTKAYRADQPTVARGEVDAGTEFEVADSNGDMLLVSSSVGNVWVRKSDVTKAGAVAQAPAVSASGKAVGEAVTASAPWLPAETMTKLIALTQSQAPLLRADWFFAMTARQIDRNGKNSGVGYYDFLGLKNQKDAEDLVGLDRAKAKKIQREIAAIVAESGVALNNRQIFRFGTVAGSWWETRDVNDSSGNKNAVRQLDEDFAPDALEVYAFLPNRLFLLLALNNKGELQATVPDNIASDDKTTSKDRRIHPSLGCIRCHAPGLQPIDDWARTFYANPPGDAKLNSPDYDRLKRLKRLYLTPLEDDFESDQVVYARALLRLTGWKPAEAAKAYGEAWKQYADTSVGGEQFALELGVTYEHMIDAFRWYVRPVAKGGGGSQDPVIVGFLKKPEFAARREYIEEAYVLAQQAIQGYKPPEKKEKEP